ncbi:polysaccharide biosynthesis/export family protein [Komagataeibacter europaeus]|uniref:polysaccharide biosynthesis/export family protein n=1 Tax=Komagataeibacter europaeus TaxID=33995 RepID=UPI000B54A374|nr:polysaccharide biosynthesis/export family protein [Komagataeibacter europaeus]ARW17171.1 Capsule polysaccharide export outer membrane protein CtrA [Komagataeibacter europaeus]
MGRYCAVVGGTVLLLAGCNTLPSSGPTEYQVNQAQKNPKKNTVGYGIVKVSPELIGLLESAAPPLFSSLDADNAPVSAPRNDTIGPGDVLQVSIYEVGSALFSPNGGGMSAGANMSMASNLPPLSVDGSGNIEIPFGGQMHVTGMTTSQLADAITARLKQKSQSPQVLVRILSDITNSVIVYGGVRRPSRIPLTPNREHILDVIALAGGEDRTVQSDEDYIVRLTRQDKIAELPLKTIENDPAQNIVMQPGDRVQVVYEPRTFSVFGATERVTQTQFTTPTLSLAEAVSRNGGPLDSRADPNAIYLFRFENADVLKRLGMAVDNGETTGPVIYQLDMMNPTNYFLAERFMMRDHDIIYIANASSDKFYKFFGLISTLISPGITAAWMAK